MSSTNAAETLACNTPPAASMPSVVTWVVQHVDAKAFFQRNMSGCTVPAPTTQANRDMYECLAEQVMVEILDIAAFHADAGRAAKEMSKLIASLNITGNRLARMTPDQSLHAWTGVVYAWTISMLRDKTLQEMIAKTNYATIRRHREYALLHSKKNALKEARERIIQGLYMTHQVWWTPLPVTGESEDLRLECLRPHATLATLYRLMDALHRALTAELQFNDYQADIEATHVIDVLQDFMQDVQTCWCNTCFDTALNIWAMAAVSISSGLKQSVDKKWQSLKVRICAQWSARGRFAEARRLFFHDLSCPELNPDRPPPTLIPDWFVKRVNKEFADSQLICADFASNDLFYQTAWQSVSKNLVKKMEDGGPSNKSKIWAKCKKVLVKSLKTFTDAEYEARCKVFTRYFALQREYKNKGVVWSNSLADEAYCVTMMVSGDFMHRVLRSVELMDKATFKVNGKSDGAASGVEVRVHALDVRQDEWYRHKTVNIPMIDAKSIVKVASKDDDFEIRCMAAFAAESMQKDPAGAQKAFELARAMTETTAGIEYMQTLAHSLVKQNSSLTDKLMTTWMDMATVPTGALEEEDVAVNKRRAKAERKRERLRAEMEACVHDLVVGVVESVPERAVQEREARQAALEARFLANPEDLSMAELRQALAVKINAVQSLHDERETLELAVRAAEKQKEATCRELQAAQMAMQTHQLELTDARAVLQRLACEAQANATELEACRRVQASQGRVLEGMVSQVAEVVRGYEQELADLRERIESEEEKGQCCICLEGRAVVALVPCGHVCVCAGCVGAVTGGTRQCPMCRADTTGVLPVFAA